MIGKKCCGNRHLDAICLGVCGFGQFVNQCFVSPTNTLWLKWAARRHAGRKWIFALLDKKNNQIQTVSMMTNYKSLTWNCKESLHVFFGWIWPLCENQSCFNMRTIFAAFVRRTPVGMHMFQSHGVGHAHMRAWTFQSTNARIAVRCVQDHAHEVFSVNDAQRRTTCPMKFLNTTNLTCCWQWGTIKSWRKSACRHQRWRTTLAPAFSGFNCCQWK